MYDIDRRSFLVHAVSASLVVGANGQVLQASDTTPVRFKHGVASGDPLSDRVILWTRISQVHGSDPLPATMAVTWEVATDSAFKKPVNRGVVVTGDVRDYTVKVDADGLSPGQQYFYRFSVGGTYSPVGRTKTLPTEMIDKARFAVVSCSNYGYGYFNVYKEIAKQTDLDAVLHLGDYIYEYDNDTYSDKALVSADRHLAPDNELIKLQDYRQRYSLYRQDPDLQAVHAAHPFICVWDDHEFANDTWHDGAENHQPEKEGDWPARRDAALQAYREWIPIRDPEVGEDPLRIYRRFDYGNLMSLIMLDTRVVGRDKKVDYLKEIVWQQVAFDMRPLQSGGKPKALTSAIMRKDVPEDAIKMVTVPFDVRGEKPEPVLDWDFISTMDPKKLPEGYSFIADAEKTRAQVINNPDRNLLGKPQEAWLEEQLKETTAQNMTWQIIGQQILTGKVSVPFISDIVNDTAYLPRHIIKAVELLGQVGLPYNMDAWDGYNVSRERFLRSVKAHGNNVVTLAGDTHNAWAFNLTPDGEDAPVAVEMATSSVSSPGMETYFASTDFHEMARRFVDHNPELVYQNCHNRGWLRLTVTPEEATGDWLYVSTVSKRDYTAVDGAHYKVKAGEHTLVKA